MIFPEKVYLEIAELILKEKEKRIKYHSISDLSLKIVSFFFKFKKDILIVVEKKEDIPILKNDISVFLEERIFSLPAWDKAVLDEFSPSADITSQRINTYYSFLDNKKHIYIVENENLYEKIVCSERFRNWIRNIKINEVVDLDKLLEFLFYSGYSLESSVLNVGEYSRRGGIVDIYSPDQLYPVRLEFFGDIIESIRYFNPSSQRSFKNIDETTILPAREIFLNKEEIKIFEEKYSEYTDPFILGGEIPAKKIRKNDIEFEHLFEDGIKFTFEKNNINRNEYIIEFGDFLTHPAKNIFTNLEENLKTIDKKYKYYLFLTSETKKKNLKKIFPEATYFHKSISSGFVINFLSTVILSEKEMFGVGKESIVRKTSYKKNVLSRDEIPYLPYNSLIVHEKSGIGRYKGLKFFEYRDQKTECLILQYANNSFLYLPVFKIDLLSRYISPYDSKNPPLSELGGKKWDKKKIKAKKLIMDMTMELAEIYAARKTVKGPLIFKDEQALVNSASVTFQYEETADQIKAIEEIFEDLENDKPMDRLICGEVGYGKTEVAIRASLKAVDSLYQVVILVPTTVLSKQHYDVFSSRLEYLPVRVEMISRFVKPKKIKKILTDLEKGKVDILIGTHRLLSDDVKFKNLGLLIIDEEHKFGVKQKEKIKKIKKNINLLLMSATPIPRTINQSLWQIMDVSFIKTPPPGRYPIETNIATFSEKIVKDAVYFEIKRGGQIFFLHNRVMSLPSMYNYLKKIMPDISIEFCHGQLKAQEIEKTMLQFYEHKFDMLLSTTIIESGLDIPNTNTLIVDRADTFGLAQLHQLRGRIGRGEKRAYCYFLIPKKGPTTDDGKERLKAIKSYSKLGAGYELALYDMRIRGAGNLLGKEQSGSSFEIGYELYIKYLNEAIVKIKSGKGDVISYETDIYAEFPYYISPEYIQDQEERLYLYRKVSLADENELELIEEEVKDRFGKLPKQTEDFFVVAKLYRLTDDLEWKEMLLSKKIKIFFAENPKRCYIENFISSLPVNWKPSFQRFNEILVVIIENWEFDKDKLIKFVKNFKDKLKRIKGLK